MEYQQANAMSGIFIEMSIKRRYNPAGGGRPNFLLQHLTCSAAASAVCRPPTTSNKNSLLLIQCRRRRLYSQRCAPLSILDELTPISRQHNATIFWNDCNHNMRILAALSLASCAVLARPFTPAGGRFATLLPSPRRTTTSSLMGGGPFDIFNEGKKAFVKSLAGEYDAIAVRTKIDSLIKDNSVLMLSFTTCPYCIMGKCDNVGGGGRL